jgi:hypothetical protein
VVSSGRRRGRRRRRRRLLPVPAPAGEEGLTQQAALDLQGGCRRQLAAPDLHLRDAQADGDAEMRAATRDHPDWGAAWRQADLDLVSSERSRRFLAEQGFVLVGWRELAAARRPAAPPPP